MKNDQNHYKALKHWQNILPQLPCVVITSYIFDEVVTFLNSRGYHEKAVRIGNRWLNSPSVKIIHIDDALFSKGWTYFQRHNDKRYSLTDCLSFVVMQESEISMVFTLDHHFTQAGFIREPQ
jgi:predicted nucleic acid-binding protein